MNTGGDTIRRITQYFGSPYERIRIALTTMGGLVLLIAALAVPRTAEQNLSLYERGLEGGPDSHFHHIYDPIQLLGQLGSIDFELNNFQDATGNIILFAAFDKMPTNDPWFTFNLAQRWAPGKKGEDRGLVIFVFPKERRIRAEIGYGYETDLTDVRMRHIIEEKMVPLLREGKMEEAVEAVARELQQSLSQLKGKEQVSTFFDRLPVYLREIRHKLGLAFRTWMTGELTARLIISGLVLLLWTWFIWLAASLMQGVINFSRRLRNAPQERKAQDLFLAVMGFINPLVSIAFAVTLVFGLLAMGEYYYWGKGLFGGGGVTLFW